MGAKPVFKLFLLLVSFQLLYVSTPGVFYSAAIAQEPVPIEVADKPDAETAKAVPEASSSAQDGVKVSPAEKKSIAAAGDNPSIKLFPVQRTPSGNTGVQTVAAGVLPEYILGPGDELAIRDFSSIESSSLPPIPNQRVLSDGSVTIPPLGVLQVAGLTLRQLNEMVNEKSSRYIVSPNIYIAVTAPRPTSVYILGEVANPGLYSTNYQPTSSDGASPAVHASGSSALLTVTGALQRAGGLTEYANVRQIKVTRLNADEHITCDMWKLLSEGDASQDPLLLAGDVVFVPKGGEGYNPKPFGLAADQHRPVRVWGAVNKPGLYEVKAGDDLLTVISQAGGFQRNANTKWVTLSRLDRDGTLKSEKINVPDALHESDAAARVHVNPGDVIVANWSVGKESRSKLGYGGVILVVFGLLYTLQYKFNKSLNQQNFGFNQQLQQSGSAIAPTSSSSGSSGNAIIP